MPVYPTYFPQMNNGYNQQMQNPYQQRMDFLQSYQQSLQQPVQPAQMPMQNQQMNVVGKIVDSIEMVRSMDIPMDGGIYYFPKADGTEIFGKQWLPSGQTRILTFKPIQDLEAGAIYHKWKKKLNLTYQMNPQRHLCRGLTSLLGR